MKQVFLTRRNLLTLLSKLDRVQNGGASQCTLIKYDTTHPLYPSSDIIEVTAVEDADYYIDRAAGEIHELDTPSN